MEQKEIVAEEKIVSKSTGIGILIVDERQVYMARLLEEKGYTVVTWDLREGPMPRGTEKLWCAGVLICLCQSVALLIRSDWSNV